MRKAFLALLLTLAVVGTAQTQVTSYVSTPAAGTVTSTLNNGLIAFWKMDETSGNRADSKGSNTLVDNNTVLYGTGKISNAADFESDNSEYLSIDDNEDLSFGNENFTISAWVYFETDPLTNTVGIVSKYDNSLPYAYEYLTTVFNSNINFIISNDGTTTTAVNSTINPTNGTWYCVTAWHNASTDSIYIKVNANAVKRARHTTGCNDNTAYFTVGSVYNASFIDGLIDLVGVWGRCPQGPTYAMADSIYNGGSGWQP